MEKLTPIHQHYPCASLRLLCDFCAVIFGQLTAHSQINSLISALPASPITQIAEPGETAKSKRPPAGPIFSLDFLSNLKFLKFPSCSFISSLYSFLISTS